MSVCVMWRAMASQGPRADLLPLDPNQLIASLFAHCCSPELLLSLNAALLNPETVTQRLQKDK